MICESMLGGTKYEALLVFTFQGRKSPAAKRSVRNPKGFLRSMIRNQFIGLLMQRAARRKSGVRFEPSKHVPDISDVGRARAASRRCELVGIGDTQDASRRPRAIKCCAGLVSKAKAAYGSIALFGLAESGKWNPCKQRDIRVAIHSRLTCSRSLPTDEHVRNRLNFLRDFVGVFYPVDEAYLVRSIHYEQNRR